MHVLEFCGDNVIIQDGTGRLGMAQLSLLRLHRSVDHRTVYEAMRRNGLEVTDGAHLGADFMCAAPDGARQSFAVRVVPPNEALSGVAALSSLFGDLSLPMMYVSVDAGSGAISCVLLNFNPQLSYNSRLGFERLSAQVIQADAAISLDTVADGGLANADDTGGSESVGESSLASVQGGVLRGAFSSENYWDAAMVSPAELSFYSISTPSTRHVFMASAQAVASLQNLSVTVEAATCVEINQRRVESRRRRRVDGVNIDLRRQHRVDGVDGVNLDLRRQRRVDGVVPEMRRWRGSPEI